MYMYLWLVQPGILLVNGLFDCVYVVWYTCMCIFKHPPGVFKNIIVEIIVVVTFAVCVCVCVRACTCVHVCVL